LPSRFSPVPGADRRGVLVDAHAHIGPTASESWEVPPPGIVVFYNSTGGDDLFPTLDLARRSRPLAAMFAGLHPTNPNRDLVSFETWFEANTASVDGVGEIGLDQRVPLEISRREFRAQLELASRWKKPVSVHTRGRLREALEDLSSYDSKALLHWFQGTREELETCMDKGYYVSFGPPSLYSKSMKRLVSAARMDRLLLETDSPVRYGACFESRESLPTMIGSVYFWTASLREVDLPELERLVEHNASSFLGKDVSALR